ncbi:MAG: amidohydrolase family protein [Desulfatibacillum sp.]|nr:amidohydrolase family protein [Desulfatibacillum sp.]
MNANHSLKAGWIVDGTGDPARKNIFITINKGRISSLDTALPLKAESPALLDYSGCTVIPGLVDAHVHLVMSGAVDPVIREAQLFASYEKAAPVINRHLDEALASGVVALRDGGDWGGHALQFVREAGPMPVIAKCAGKAWRASKRYGKLVGRAPVEGQSLAEALKNDDQSPDFIKVVGSGLNSLVEFGKQTPPQFSLEELTEAVEAARSMGLDVMVHANGDEPVRIAVEAGCQSVEHGFFMGRENLKRMADKGTVWVPTAVTMESYAQSLPMEDPQRDGALRNLEAQVKLISLARELGVTLAVGTDAGSTGVHHGRSLWREMALFMEAGFSVEEVIQATCRTGAGLLELPDLGVLEAGKEATLVVVKGSPKDLPQSLKNPVAVIVRGEVQTP